MYFQSYRNDSANIPRHDLAHRIVKKGQKMCTESRYFLTSHHYVLFTKPLVFKERVDQLH